ncbi:MAG: hypothetical protein ACREAF_06145, partial [Nitrosopumilaceae archaeon]
MMLIEVVVISGIVVHQIQEVIRAAILDMILNVLKKSSPKNKLRPNKLNQLKHRPSHILDNQNQMAIVVEKLFAL